MKAVAYVRISKIIAGVTPLGFARQEADIRATAERNGDEIVAVYSDNETAYKGKRRPGFRAALDALDDPEIGAIYAWAVDRLIRHPRELEDVIDRLEQTRTTVVAVKDGVLDLTTSTGRMTARVVGAMARAESERKSERTCLKADELFERGEIGGGSRYRPFGYEPDMLTIREAEARTVREVCDRVVAGQSLGSIARSLNERGLTTTAGNAWTGGAVRQMVLSPRIAGLRVDTRRNKGRTFEARWTGIISHDEHRRLVAVLTNPDRKSARGREPYLLTGFLRCGECGTKLVGRPDCDGRSSYQCPTAPGRPGCGRVRVAGAPVERIIIKAVQDRLAGGAFARAVEAMETVDDAADLAEIARIDARMIDLGREMAEPDALRDLIRAEAVELQARKAACTDRLRQSSANTARVAVLTSQRATAGVWPDTVAEQRTYLAEIVVDVPIAKAVKRGPVFDGSRIGEPNWKV